MNVTFKFSGKKKIISTKNANKQNRYYFMNYLQRHCLSLYGVWIKFPSFFWKEQRRLIISLSVSASLIRPTFFFFSMLKLSTPGITLIKGLTIFFVHLQAIVIWPIWPMVSSVAPQNWGVRIDSKPVQHVSIFSSLGFKVILGVSEWWWLKTLIILQWDLTWVSKITTSLSPLWLSEEFETIRPQYYWHSSSMAVRTLGYLQFRP